MSDAPRILTLFESPELLGVSKPEGIASIPERDLAVPSVRRTLEAERGETLYVVHRLDKEVSGVLLFARTAAAHRELSLLFEQRKLEKTYLALVHGRVERQEFAIEAPLREYGSGRMGVDPRGKASRTRVKTLVAGDAYSLLEVRPETGRRHQIRVHLYAEGHPLVGDPRYGESTRREPGRLMLHASKLALPALSFSPAFWVDATPPSSFLQGLEQRGFRWPLATTPG